MYANETARTVYRIFDSVEELTTACQHDLTARQAKAAEKHIP
ncbi:hypothetical protein LCGC14_1915350, partial [marine sediment metagenome]